MLRILGIDPGFDRTGFGVIDQRGSEATWVAHGCIQTLRGEELASRLKQTHDELVEIIKKYKPEVVGVEKLFFQTNVKTAINVSMGRGVIFLAIADAGLPIVEITPQQIKQGITGWGAAGKKGVQEMVKRFLKLTEVPKPDDAADALAIAIVSGLMYRTKRS